MVCLFSLDAACESDFVWNGEISQVESVTSSELEHHASIILEQGYDSMFTEAMLPT